MTTSLNPLVGDADGCYRVRIIGNSGVGKSTLGNWLAGQIGVPYIPLDHYCWQPGWKETPRNEFRDKVQTTLEQNRNGWVIDGNYTGHVGDLVDREATDIIWLDPPLLLYLPRLCLRTFLRILSCSPPCSPGCQETLARTFSSESIIWWSITNHSRLRRRETTRMQELDAQNINIMRRIRGWGGELRQWQCEVEVVFVHTSR